MEAVQKNNALIVPQTFQRDFEHGKDNFVHGVVRNGTDPVYFSHMRSGRPLLNEKLQSLELAKQPARLAGKWLYLGGIHPHFGHFLSECIHRIWAWKEYRDQCRGVLFLPNIKEYELGRHLAGYAKEIFGLLGLEESAIRYITELTEVDELIVPEPGSQLGKPALNEYLEFLSTLQLGKRFANQPLPEGFSPKVFVSRKNYRNHRSVAGLDALETGLQQNGYYIFYPEKHSIPAQLKVYLEAEKIIFEEGSAIHLLELLDKIEADVLVINRRENAQLFTNIIRPRTKHYVNYNQFTFLPRLSDKYDNALPVTDMRDLFEFMALHDFISPSMAIAPNWMDNAKKDMLNHLLQHANSSMPEFNGKVVEYLQSVNGFLKSVNTIKK
ncbi:MAG: hypothetical protein CTY16_10125 [Methylobacter sp.]|nr:MAG: hypothetical protein CTY16_10125 [Methylobacter sp.]